MKEICFINKGDSIEKLKYQNGYKYMEKSPNKIFGFDYAVVENGLDDIIVVRNYNPYFIKNIKEGETKIDLFASGYDSDVSNINVGDKIVISKISGLQYIVKPMETINDISKKFDVEKEKIIELNKLKGEKLFVGQILII